MRQTLLIGSALVLVALVAGAGVAAAVGFGPGVATGDAPGRTIAVSADGSASAPPDQAVVHLAVTATGDDATTARERVAANASRLRDALAAAGLDDDQVRTVGYDLRRARPPKRPAEQTERPSEYRARHAFEVTVNDTDRVGELIDVAVSNGATDVNGVSFGLSAEQRRDLESTALADAMANARTKAGTLADAADLRVTGVHAVSTSGGGYRAYPDRVVMASAGGDGGTAIESGPVSVSVTVSVVYNATAA